MGTVWRRALASTLHRPLYPKERKLCCGSGRLICLEEATALLQEHNGYIGVERFAPIATRGLPAVTTPQNPSLSPKPKRLVLCFDGTWGTLADPNELTNVVKLASLVGPSDGDIPQIIYYNSGVGTGGPIDKLLGGAFGVGLKANVKRGLAFLTLNYQAGDEIYLFGFSRGAYTARALSGLLGTAGIPRDISTTEQHWGLYRELAKLKDKAGWYPRGHRKRAPFDAEIEARRQALAGSTRFKGGEVPIRCVGVWDTVGSYGIPAGFGLGGLARRLTLWTRGFRDTKIGDKVELALHAVAVDETRRPFEPTFWTRRVDREPVAGQKVEQVWFPGVHANIGGGYQSAGLSDQALVWMIARVTEETGLKFNAAELPRRVRPCPAGMLYPAHWLPWLAARRSVLLGSFPLVRSALRNWWRRLHGAEEGVQVRRINEKVHWSVRERCGWPEALVDRVGRAKYAPANLAAVMRGLAEDDVTKPTPLELRLLQAPHAEAAARAPVPSVCVLKQQGGECRCREATSAHDAGAQPAAVA
jgi:uncharacterized protein (DUF2235 family)